MVPDVGTKFAEILGAFIRKLLLDLRNTGFGVLDVGGRTARSTRFFVFWLNLRSAGKTPEPHYRTA